MDRQELFNECDVLVGNINIIMETDDQEEMIAQFIFAIQRVEKIFTTRYKDLLDKKVKKFTLKQISEYSEADILAMVKVYRNNKKGEKKDDR